MKEIQKQTIFVNGLVHNADQAVLVLRRSLKDHYLPGYLELPGGRLQTGESLEHALQRKLMQEAGIDGRYPLYYTSLSEDDKHGPYTRVVFEVKYNPKDAIKLSGNHSEYLWVSRDDLVKEKFAGNTKKILEQYLGAVKSTTVTIDDKDTTLIVYSDGGSRGNPGPSASGFVIYDSRMKELEAGGKYIGITTNNQAEYTAVVLALEAAKKYADSSSTINFYMDSMLVVNQMNGVYKIKNRDLWPIHQQIRELMKNFKSVQFSHVYREKNTAADAQVNEILDAQAA